MKIPLRYATGDWKNKLGVSLFLLFLVSDSFSFQTETPFSIQNKSDLNGFELLEAGLVTQKNVKSSIYFLGEGDYVKALEEVKKEPDSAWLDDYLEGLIKVFPPLERSESEHFILWTPPGQMFLADYALPSLEKTGDHIEKVFGHRPKGKIRVEIYPNKEEFSTASTLSVETLERSGAIGICKFHRLMIMSPKSLPLGYRWLDALSHEYIHLTINELSHTKAELWLHEGTARYFETSYRLNPPAFLTPDQQTKLLEAMEKKSLVTFARMSPSMVYLKDQEEVSLAFAQVAHAVSVMVGEKGISTFVRFLKTLQSTPFKDAFRLNYGIDPTGFEKQWQEALSKEKWEKSKGTMSDEIRFQQLDESTVIGADVQGQVRLGDRMRRQNLFEAALIQYEKALAEEPDNASILLKTAKTHLALNQSDRAIERLRRATQKNPNYGTPHIELAQLVCAEEALPHLLEANAINPFDPRIHKALAEIYASQQKLMDAVREEKIFQILTEAP